MPVKSNRFVKEERPVWEGERAKLELTVIQTVGNKLLILKAEMLDNSINHFIRTEIGPLPDVGLGHTPRWTEF